MEVDAGGRLPPNVRAEWQSKKPGFLKGPRRQGHAINNQKEATLSLVPKGLIVGHLKLGSVAVADPIQVRYPTGRLRERMPLLLSEQYIQANQTRGTCSGSTNCYPPLGRAGSGVA